MRFSAGLTLLIIFFGAAMMATQYVFAPWSLALWVSWLVITVLAVIAGHIILFRYATEPPGGR